MTKTQLVDHVAKEAGLTKAKAAEAVNAIFDFDNGAIPGSLKAGEKVIIPGFGTFEAKQRNARTGRNPSTGEPIEIAAKKAPTFSAGKTLKDFLA